MTNSGQPKGPSSQHDRAVLVAIIGALGLVLAAVAGGIIAHVMGPGPATSSPTPRSASPTIPTPPPSPTNPSPSLSTTAPTPTGTGILGSAQITNVTSATGSSCISDTVQVDIAISSPASADRELWLMAIVMTGTPIHPVYYAKRQLANAAGPQTPIIQFIGAAKGSVRNLVIVSSGPASFNWLKQNLANDGVPAWDINRVDLHGVTEISRFYKVTQQC